MKKPYEIVMLDEKEIIDCFDAALLFNRALSDKEFWAITFGKALCLKMIDKNSETNFKKGLK